MDLGLPPQHGAAFAQTWAVTDTRRHESETRIETGNLAQASQARRVMSIGKGHAPGRKITPGERNFGPLKI